MTQYHTKLYDTVLHYNLEFLVRVLSIFPIDIIAQFTFYFILSINHYLSLEVFDIEKYDFRNYMEFYIPVGVTDFFEWRVTSQISLYFYLNLYLI